MKKQRLKWDDELDVGTVKVKRCLVCRFSMTCIVCQLKEEKKKLRAALEEIANQETPRSAFTMKHDNLVDIAKEALK